MQEEAEEKAMLEKMAMQVPPYAARVLRIPPHHVTLYNMDARQPGTI